MGVGIGMAKYAVFVDDGLNATFSSKNEAKSYAAEMRAEIKAMGRHDSCYFKKMTREQEKLFS